MFPQLVVGLFSLVASSIAHPTLHTHEPRIYNGETAGPHEFPYVVSLQMKRQHYCAGVLLSADRVLTAAHCQFLFDDNATVEAYGGSYDLTTGGQHIKVTKFVNHPDYDDWTTNNDVSIWHLARPFCGHGIKYAQLPEPGSDPVEGDSITPVGWGVTEDEENMNPDRLKKVTVPIVGRAKCNSIYESDDLSSITESKICSGPTDGVENVYKGGCFEDSGGPGIADSKVVGIISYGMGCVTMYYPEVFTRVGHFVDWIQENM